MHASKQLCTYWRVVCVIARESQVKADDDLEAQRAAILHQFHYENIEILAIVEVRQSSCQSLFGYCLQGCFVVKGTV
eukprot:m.119590 g.119590  ORF g.119590 m.119590 type:complete len:77 (-) comp15598_c0_seq3:3450-3680(-)